MCTRSMCMHSIRPHPQHAASSLCMDVPHMWRNNLHVGGVTWSCTKIYGTILVDFYMISRFHSISFVISWFHLWFHDFSCDFLILLVISCFWQGFLISTVISDFNCDFCFPIVISDNDVQDFTSGRLLNSVCTMSYFTPTANIVWHVPSS